MTPPGTNTTQTDLCAWLCAHLSRELRVPLDRIDPDEPMVTYGLDSLTAAGIIAAVEDRVGFAVDPNALWDCPTASSFAAFLTEQTGAGR